MAIVGDFLRVDLNNHHALGNAVGLRRFFVNRVTTIPVMPSRSRTGRSAVGQRRASIRSGFHPDVVELAQSHLDTLFFFFREKTRASPWCREPVRRYKGAVPPAW